MSPITPSIRFNPTDTEKVVKAALESLAKKLNVPIAQLPPDIKSTVEAVAQSTLDARAKTIIGKDVDGAVKSELLRGVKPLDMLTERMQAAQTGIAHIAGDANVDSILADTAKLLKKKFDALHAVGFTDEQSFSLLLAETTARSGRAG
jgi:hypothetical protein